VRDKLIYVTAEGVTLPARSAAEARTTDPIFAAITAHQAAWELAREASDDDIDALMEAEARQLAELLRMTPTTIAGAQQ